MTVESENIQVDALQVLVIRVLHISLLVWYQRTTFFFTLVAIWVRFFYTFITIFEARSQIYLTSHGFGSWFRSGQQLSLCNESVVAS